MQERGGGRYVVLRFVTDMRILLISLNRETEPFTAAPLGLAMVAGALLAEGHDVSVVDLLFETDGAHAVRDAMRFHRPGMVCLSLRNIESSTEFLLPGYRDVVAALKEDVGVPVLAGGPGFSIMPEDILRYLGLEYGIAGEGERAVVEFARALKASRDPATVQGVCTLRDGVFGLTPNEHIEDLSSAGTPAWGLFPVKEYDMVGVQSKRGCSFSCVYCTYPSLEGRRMRLREPARVARDVAELKAVHGVEAVYFVDNVFNNPKPHAEAVCRELVSIDAGVEWGALVTPAGLDSRFVGLMASAGCKSVEIGADSLSAKALKGLGKPFSPSDVASAVNACRDAGLMSMMFLILGGPGEDEDTLKETFDALDAIRPDKVFAVAGIRLYPGTPLSRTAVDEGVLDASDSLLMPRFYVSGGLGERLYDIAGGFFGSHPDWIYYRADALVTAAGANAAQNAARGVTGWSAGAEICLADIISEIPRLIRPVARKAVVRRAEALAGDRMRDGVTVSDVVEAFLSETPGPFRASMKKSLMKHGLIDG